MRQFQASDEKLRELILYVGGKRQWTIGRLARALYYSDFMAYASSGQPITGQEYCKMQDGPAPRRLPVLMDSLTSEGAAVLNGDQFGVKRSARLSLFSMEEINLTDSIIAELDNPTAESTGWLSYRLVGWFAAHNGETIPYASIFVSNRPLIEWMKGDVNYERD